MLTKTKSKEYLSDGIIELRLRRVARKHAFLPIAYQYEIYKYQSKELIGRCDYRCENNEENYYAGNIGYMILPQFRGNGYAGLATQLLCELARKMRVKKLYITCSPDNLASKRTIEKLSVSFIEEVAVPQHHYLYVQGEKVKNIYLLKL